MKHVGVKLTHDAAVAMIEDGELRFSVELEKIDNNPRHAFVQSLSEVSDILRAEGVDPVDVDSFVLDGWKHGQSKRPLTFNVAPYHEGDARTGERPWGSLLRSVGTPAPLPGGGNGTVSYPHVTGHVVGAYAMSPWAEEKSPAYVLVWDGGVNPRLYYVAPNAQNPVEFVGHVHFLYGMIYGVMGYYFGPYRSAVPEAGPAFGQRDWPGKLMSWIAKGKALRPIMDRLRMMYEAIERREIAQPMRYQNGYNQNAQNEHELIRCLFGCGYSDEDVLASVHAFLEELLVERVTRMVPVGALLAFTGGSALNIKWNMALRETGHFDDVFVPPVANDSGSALGQAATSMVTLEDRWALKWSVFAGPRLGLAIEPGWRAVPCSVPALATKLTDNQPVVVLHGRAEIGPRALGHRSLMMNPSAPHAQKILNDLKGRESWRPVAPMVLEDAAPDFFKPGSADPFMLFDHYVIPTQRRVIPAVVHIDGTARVQTVSRAGNPFAHELLTAWRDLGYAPVLCNTSANLNGSGFFPDIASAMRWGKVPAIWAEGILYTKEEG